MCVLAQNEGHGQDWYVFCQVVRMGSERKFCRICGENLLPKLGSCAAFVSLFLETSNKKMFTCVQWKTSHMRKVVAEYWSICCPWVIVNLFARNTLEWS